MVGVDEADLDGATNAIAIAIFGTDCRKANSAMPIPVNEVIQCFHSLPDVLKWSIPADDLQWVGELQKEIHFFLDWRVLGK